MRDNLNMEELSDQAWSKMKVLLDQEMPVQGSDRKPVFWWFRLAAAVLLVAAVTAWWWNWSDATRPNLSPAGQIAAQEIPSREQGGEQLNEISSARTTEVHGTSGTTRPVNDQSGTRADIRPDSFPNTADVRSAGQPSTDTAGAGREVETGFTSGSATVPELTDEEETLPAKPMVAITDQTGEGPEQTPVSPEADQLSMIPDERPARLVLEFSSLPGKDIPALPLSPLPLTHMQTDNPRKPVGVPLEVGAGVLFGLAQGNTLGGQIDLRTGLYLHKSRKWSFRTGVGLRHQRAPFEVDFKKSLNAEEATTGGSPNMDNQTGSDPQNAADFSFAEAVQTRGLYLFSTYVDVPLLVDWRFARRWSLAFGSRLSWLTIADWGTSGLSSNRSGGLGFSSQNDPLVFDLSNANRSLSIAQSGSNATPASVSLSNFYASGTIGFAYHLSNRWRLRLEYQHSLTNLLDSSVYQQTDRSLWISAAMQF